MARLSRFNALAKVWPVDVFGGPGIANGRIAAFPLNEISMHRKPMVTTSALGALAPWGLSAPSWRNKARFWRTSEMIQSLWGRPILSSFISYWRS